MYIILVLFISTILVLLKLGTSVPLFHLASYKIETSDIKMLNLIGSLLTMFSGRILSVFI